MTKIHCLLRILSNVLISIEFLCIIITVKSLNLNNGNNGNNDNNDNNDNNIREKHFHQAVWPFMKHHDIWDDNTNNIETKINHENNYVKFNNYNNNNNNNNSYNYNNDRELNGSSVINMINTTKTTIINNYLKNKKKTFNKMKQSKVLHLFPVPVDGECLSNDGRRSGTCFNPYECRAKGGTAKGECAMGFGVCCVFIADCNETITNNMTYVISPNFPSFMSENFTKCNWTIKLMDKTDVSQLRIDFYHFTLGQPNRHNGVCDGDRFRITGGLSRSFTLCGQNNGQHVYYDIGIPSTMQLPRQNQLSQILYGNLRPLTYDDVYPDNNNSNRSIMDLSISLEFSQRYLPSRLWEIRITQIPFSQRAPPGCLQYFTGNEGIIQTFNFADNGRHLANQNYRICMRQEMNMCSIVYQPCDAQSFRIGPNFSTMSSSVMSTNSMPPINQMNDVASSSSMAPLLINMTTTSSSSNSSNVMPISTQSIANDAILNNMTTTTQTTTAMQMNISDSAPTTSTTMTTTTTTTTAAVMADDATSAAMATSASSTLSMTSTTVAAPSADDPTSTSPSVSSETSAIISSTTSATSVTSSSLPTSTLSDDVEGSGDSSDGQGVRPVTPSRRPRPVGGGFDIIGFIRDTFDFNVPGNNYRHREKRQFYTTCRDRLTMPCIIEDFIDNGMGPLPGCEPVHCGSQFCASGRWPCSIESTVTPFYIGIHFGDGRGKGSAEDNIGACLRYTQVQCI